MKTLYLDVNAHQAPSDIALKSFLDFQNTKAAHGHPSSFSSAGLEASLAYEQAREKIANLLGAQSPSQIIFTTGATQACQWALQILFHNYQSKNLIWCSKIDHPAIVLAYQYFCQKYQIPEKYLSVSPDGQNIISKLQQDKVISTHLQNEYGTIQDISNCSVVDMAQSLGKIPLNVSGLNIEMAIFGAHKIGGMGNFGILYLQDPSQWQPFGTGSRYFMDRAGTPEVGLAVSFANTLQNVIDSLSQRTQQMQIFQNYIEREFENLGLEIIGKNSLRSFSTTMIKIPNLATEMILQLSQKEIMVGAGSACSSLHTDLSPSLRAINQNGSASDFIRISTFGEYGEREAQQFINHFKEIYGNLSK